MKKEQEYLPIEGSHTLSQEDRRRIGINLENYTPRPLDIRGENLPPGYADAPF